MKKIVMLIPLIVAFLLSGCSILGINNSNIQKKSSYDSNLIDAKQYSNNEELLERVSPAVVGILSISNQFQSIGTGVCVSEKGYILTNNHVIDGSNLIKLFLFDGTTAMANLIWRDSSQDLAILQSNVKLPYLPMAEANSYKAGQDVIAIGTPLSLAFKHTATKGMISALNRTIQVDNDNGNSTLSSLIQHDASINPGNSGGPLIDLSGRVLGINTVKVTDAEGLGFAIPISIGNAVISKLKTNGFYNTSYLGVMGYDVNMNNFESDDKGIFLVSVDENSPAYKAGIEKGDVITKINNIDINNILELRLKLLEMNKGDNITVTFKRNGNIYNKNIMLGEHPYCYKNNMLKLEDFN